MSLVVILGDFNIDIDDTTNSHVKCFVTPLEQYDLRQHIIDPSHFAGHVIDLIISGGSSGESIFLCMTVILVIIILLIVSSISLEFLIVLNVVMFARGNRWILRCFFSDNLLSPVCNFDCGTLLSIDALADMYNNVLSALADRHAPVVALGHRRFKSVPWFTGN